MSVDSSSLSDDPLGLWTGADRPGATTLINAGSGARDAIEVEDSVWVEGGKTHQVGDGHLNVLLHAEFFELVRSEREGAKAADERGVTRSSNERDRRPGGHLDRDFLARVHKGLVDGGVKRHWKQTVNNEERPQKLKRLTGFGFLVVV
jgi:hypothetical protein